MKGSLVGMGSQLRITKDTLDVDADGIEGEQDTFAFLGGSFNCTHKYLCSAPSFWQATHLQQ